jgi:hypothetical protein
MDSTDPDSEEKKPYPMPEIGGMVDTGLGFESGTWARVPSQKRFDEAIRMLI